MLLSLAPGNRILRLDAVIRSARHLRRMSISSPPYSLGPVAGYNAWAQLGASWHRGVVTWPEGLPEGTCNLIFAIHLLEKDRGERDSDD